MAYVMIVKMHSWRVGVARDKVEEIVVDRRPIEYRLKDEKYARGRQ
mgnify:CR=1 FL=1